MFKAFLKFFIFFIYISIITACSNKKPIEKNASLAPKLPVIKTHSHLAIGRNIISEKTHVYIRQEQLPYLRTDTSSQRILLIGDSMSKWLRYRLGDYCQQNGHKLFTVTWVSGNTEWFAKYDTLNY